MSDKLREAFERDFPAWWSKRLDDGSYSDPFRQKQWEAFQVGHAHAMRTTAGPLSSMVMRLCRIIRKTDHDNKAARDAMGYLADQKLNRPLR